MTRTLMCLPLLTALVATPVLANPPEGKGPKGEHGQAGKSHGGWQASQPSVQHGNKGGQDKHHDKGGQKQGLKPAGISADEARRMVGELQLQGVGSQGLPPGIRKNLARGKPLPPGIAKRFPPQALAQRLPQQPGYEWQVVGPDLVLVELGTRVVHDILRDIFIPR